MLVVIDKSTKLGHFIPTQETVTSQETASLYLHHVWNHHGTPEAVISDRGPVFVSKFMRRLFDLLRIKPSPTTAFHPQANGQIERVNQVLEGLNSIPVCSRREDKMTRRISCLLLNPPTTMRFIQPQDFRHSAPHMDTIHLSHSRLLTLLRFRHLKIESDISRKSTKN